MIIRAAGEHHAAHIPASSSHGTLPTAVNSKVHRHVQQGQQLLPKVVGASPDSWVTLARGGGSSHHAHAHVQHGPDMPLHELVACVWRVRAANTAAAAAERSLESQQAAAAAVASIPAGDAPSLMLHRALPRSEVLLLLHEEGGSHKVRGVMGLWLWRAVLCCGLVLWPCQGCCSHWHAGNRSSAYEWLQIETRCNASKACMADSWTYACIIMAPCAVHSRGGGARACMHP